MRGVEAVQIDPEDVGAERMRGVMASSSAGCVPTSIKTLLQSRPRPASPSDMDLAELADHVFQVSQKLRILHMQLLVLLLVFVLLSLHCVVSKAGVIL